MEPYLEVRNHCVLLWLGDGQNRLRTPYVKKLLQLLDTILTDDKYSECTALITVGKGRYFSNGIDLAWLGERETEAELTTFLQALSKLLAQLLTFPMLTVAAMNGHAFAGGALIALVHDKRIMQHSAGWLCFPEVFLKLQFRKAMLCVIESKVPKEAMTDFIVLGHRFTAQQAADARLVNKAIPKEADILAVAEQITREALLMDSPRMRGGEYSREGIAMQKESVYRLPILELLKETEAKSFRMSKL